jgi:polysaccharide chain length determinant protein (PEP-CTERM system associated)
MSAEFRQRKPAEYARMVWRRKWLILLPALAVTLAVAWAVWKLPNVYESTTLLTVRPASISTNIVPQLSDNDLTLRINNIGQEVTSRTTLEPLITKYNLYAKERAMGEPMDALVERMRTRDIEVKLNTSRNEVTNGFFLSFRGPDPRVTKAVTEELASKYTRAQTEAAGRETTLTREFFNQKLQESADGLAAIDRRRLEVMQSRIGSLPSEQQALVSQLAGLREQQQTLLLELGRMNDQKTSLNKLVADLDKARSQEIDEVAERVTDPKTTQAYAELVKRKAQLESERESLLTTFKPKHPDVVSVENQIASIDRQMNDMVEEGKRRVEEQRQRLGARVDPRLNSYRSDLARLDGEIGRQQKLYAQTEGSINSIERRLNMVPVTDVELEKINRDYASAKAVYEKLLDQQKKAEIVNEVAINQQGESIAVLDPANLPEKPVAPKRPLLMLLGLAAGLGCGVFFAAAFEAPRLLTVQNGDDAEHYTGLPVLVTLPTMLTPREERMLRLRRAAFAVVGVGMAVFAIPALYFVLTRLHLVELLASRG